MRNFFKKIAFVLALAMVLGNMAPAMTASAAAAPGLKYASRVLYVGGDALGLFDESCWTPSQNHANYNVTYKWDSKIIDVAPNGKITANGTGVGAAVVTVTYTNKTNAKDVVTAKFTAKVRRNATDVKLTAASAAKIANALKVGDVVELDAAKSVTASKSYAKGNYGLNNYRGVCNDNLVIESDDDTIVSVDGMKITAVAAGTVKITVVAYQYGQNKATGVKKDYTVIVEDAGILGAQQITSNTVKVAFGQELPDDVKADDFEVVQVATTADFGIKGIEVSSDRKSVTIETFFDMNDGGKYEVKYTKGDVAYEKVFDATDGVVASLNLNKAAIPYNYATVITVDLYDVNGIKIASVKESESAKYNLEWTWDTNGALMDDKIILYTKGDTAKLTVTYRTGEYKDGEEITVGPRTFEIKALDIAIDSTLKATITGKVDSPCVYDWAGLTENRELKAEDENMYVHLRVTDDIGKEITQDLFNDYGYYLESSNENILQVQPHVVHDHTQWNSGHFDDDEGIYAAVYGIRAGSANVIVKNADGKVMMSIPVTVQAKRKFVTFDLSTTNVSVSNTAYLDLSATVDMTVRDQYGPRTGVNYDEYIDVELQNAATVGNAPNYTVTLNSNNLMRLTFKGSGCDAGTYRYKVTMTKDGVTQVKYISVVVREAENTGAETYKLVIGGALDSAYTASNHNGRKTEIYVEHYKGGVLYDYLPFDVTDASDLSSGALSASCNTIQTLTISYGTSAAGKTTIVSGSAIINVHATGTVTGGATSTPIDVIDGSTWENTKVFYNTNAVSGISIGKSTTVIEKATKGTRTVRAEIINSKGQKTTLTGSFTIIDSQPSITAVVNTASVSLAASSGNTIEDAIKKALVFKVNGKTINEDAEAAKITIVGIRTTGLSTINGVSNISATGNDYTQVLGIDTLQAGDKLAVGTILIQYTQQDRSIDVWYEVPVNRIINITR